MAIKVKDILKFYFIDLDKMYKGNFTEGERLELIKGLNRVIIALKNVNGFNN
ncbi:MAG: hypothetical protein MRQ09_03565 [Candidatus Midichloria sp.]|nr:hypothetical protein [Candidatus Midichloria sp.]